MDEKVDVTQVTTQDSQSCCDSSCKPDESIVTQPGDDEALAEFAKSLAHPVRVHIVRLLAQQNTCICAEVVNDLGLPQSTVSQHLKVLHQAGLVKVSDEGRSRRYCLSQNGLRRLRSLIVNL